MQLINGEKTLGCMHCLLMRKKSEVLKSISMRLLGAGILY